jgi:hypothetical protein
VFFAEWVTQKLLVTVRAEVVAKLFVVGGQFVGGVAILFDFPENLAQFFHAVGVQIVLGKFGWFLGGKDFELDHIAPIGPGREFLPAQVARVVKHTGFPFLGDAAFGDALLNDR